MLERSFCFLPRVGPKNERRLWKQGITSWSDFLDTSSISGIGPKQKADYDQAIAQAGEHLRRENARYFAVALSSSDHWRVYEWLRPRAVYLDIETNSFGQITVVGLYANGEYTAFVRGDSLNASRLSEAFAAYDLLVTFNGTSFDLPMLLASFPDLPLDQPHLDLCLVGRRLGYRGGLKAVEVQLGIPRHRALQGLDGGDAIQWWNRWQRRRDQTALDLLLAYNEADCVNLVPIADRFYCELCERLLKN